VTALESPIPDLDARPQPADAGSDDFTRLARRVRDRIRSWARRLTGDQDEAEDITQDVLLRLHDQLDAVDDPRRLIGWLYRVTHNAAHDRRRLMQRRAALLAEYTDPDAITAPERSSAGATERMARLVADYHRTLTGRQREVFLMVDLQGHSADEAADRLGIAASTARVHLARARRTIRLRMLAEHPALLEEYADEMP
jgi:RNA polymerase sigma-70 factor (ECF subfamily)